MLNRPITVALGSVDPTCTYISRQVHVRLCCRFTGVCRYAIGHRFAAEA